MLTYKDGKKRIVEAIHYCGEPQKVIDFIGESRVRLYPKSNDVAIIGYSSVTRLPVGWFLTKDGTVYSRTEFFKEFGLIAR